MLRSFTLFLLIGFLIGCSDQFRYPCQDPENWSKPMCKPPICEASQTCTSDVLGYEPEIGKKKGSK